MVLSSADIFFSKSVFLLLFFLFFSVISVECQAVWIQIMPLRSDLDLNCLQRLSADDTSKSRVYEDTSSKLESKREIANRGYTLNL